MKHTTAYKGKRVWVCLKGGRWFIDKLVEDRGRHYEFEQEGRISKALVTRFAIWRQRVRP